MPNWRINTCVLAAAAASAAIFQIAPEWLLRGSLPLTVVALSSFFLAANSVCVVFLYPFFFSPLRHLPGPKAPSYINGNAWEIVKEFTGKPMRAWVRDIPNNGLIRYKFFLNNERIIPTNTKALAEILVTRNYDYEKPKEIRSALGQLTGVGILLAEGDEHKHQRKNLMPAFQYRHIKDLYPTFWKKAAEMCELLGDDIARQVKDGGASNGAGIINISPWLNRCTLDIIGMAGLGYDFGSLANPQNEAFKAYQLFFTPTPQARLVFMLGFFLPFKLVRALPFQRNTDVKNAVGTIRNVARRVVEEKRRSLEKARSGDADVSEKGAGQGKHSKDIISVALESGGFTNENLVDQTMTFLVAGHETTATATAWAMRELALRGDVQARLRREIHEHIPGGLYNDGADMSAEVLDRLPYLHAVCNEILRFYPPVSITRRETCRDTEIVGQFIPKGTSVLIPPAAINFSKELWGEDVDEFNPDRWMGEGRANTGGATSNYANLTFIHGPRACIGQSFSKSEFHCILAALVGRFEFSLTNPDKELEVQTGLVMRVKGGVELRIKPVEGW